MASLVGRNLLRGKTLQHCNLHVTMTLKFQIIIVLSLNFFHKFNIYFRPLPMHFGRCFVVLVNGRDWIVWWSQTLLFDYRFTGFNFRKSEVALYLKCNPLWWGDGGGNMFQIFFFTLIPLSLLYREQSIKCILVMQRKWNKIYNEKFKKFPEKLRKF